ncbi:hypothetical protein ES703_115588 [subsurface metagenome]
MAICAMVLKESIRPGDEILEDLPDGDVRFLEVRFRLPHGSQWDSGWIESKKIREIDKPQAGTHGNYHCHYS